LLKFVGERPIWIRPASRAFGLRRDLVANLLPADEDMKRVVST
jgi:hypothetical protein